MKKTIRTLVAAGCVAGSAGCVSGPKPRPLPPPAECPPGAAAVHTSASACIPGTFTV